MVDFLDSLAAKGPSDPGTAFAHRLMLARWYRHSGRAREAYLLLDSLRNARPDHDPYVSYLMNYQVAKTLLELEVFDQALQAARKAAQDAQNAGLPRKAMEMVVTACEIDLGADRLHEAQECFSKALERARSENDGEAACRSLIGLGNVYYYQEQDADALRLYNEALVSAKENGDAGLIHSALFNIGASVSYSASADSAIRLYHSVLDTMRGDPLGTDFRADLLGNLASLYSDKDDHAQALELTDKALSIYEAAHDTASMAQSHLFKATALWEMGQRQAAVQQAKLAMERTRSMGLKAQAMRKAADYLRLMGRNEESLELLNSYSALADSLAKSRYSLGIAGAQVRYETLQKERRIAEQEQALTLAAAEDRRKSIQRNALIGATALLVAIALLLYRSMRNRQRLAQQQKELHSKQVDQLLAQQELKSINAMLEGQENERDRMGRDLHDRLGSMLGGIKANMAALEDRVEAMRQDQQYQKVNRLLDQTVSELRQISHDMAAATLNRFGLEKALKDLRDTLHISGRLHVELNTFGLDQRLERSVEIALYRIVQELVSNMLKHAKASELTIGVTRAPGRLSVVVSDNGIGFDPSSMSGGMGLSNVRSRATAIGATVQVDSTPGKGTTVSVECPVVE